MKKLNAFQLKNIALIAMIMDHSDAFYPPAFQTWVHLFSRFVAPLFVFFMVEGLFHTRNKLKYNIRLFGWAIFMQAGDFIINKILISKQVSVHSNIFMTLAVGLTVINLFEHSKKSKGFKKLGLIILAILIIPLGVFTEGGVYMIPFTVVTYFFREKRNRAIIGYVILSVYFISSTLLPYTTTVSEAIEMLNSNTDILFITVVPFIFLYNGERGPNTKFSKYFFYVFYPLHLWILAIIQFAIK
ncbi:conjugal transfer protein TraX [Clostridium estertheticum]|uniref:TraX family protein n=1 Tax=Clostridium estertheticum TaxID=238834 RepID=UPI001C0D5931|nr:TraX family protein [Clostridium estertheticum]MBU3179383.1 conjugal transfer protein TraX [Clostridium estertheticum]